MKILRCGLIAVMFASSIVSADSSQAYKEVYYDQSETLKAMISNPQVLNTGSYAVSETKAVYRNGFLFFCDPSTTGPYNFAERDSLMCNGKPMLNAQSFLDVLLGSDIATFVGVDIVYTKPSSSMYILKYRANGIY